MFYGTFGTQNTMVALIFRFDPRKGQYKVKLIRKGQYKVKLCPPRGSVDRALDSGSENPGSSRSGARYSTPGGDGRRSVAGTARGPGEAGEWGGPCPVVGARKTLDLNSAGQQELRDRMVEVRAGATSYA